MWADPDKCCRVLMVSDDRGREASRVVALAQGPSLVVTHVSVSECSLRLPDPLVDAVLIDLDMPICTNIHEIVSQVVSKAEEAATLALTASPLPDLVGKVIALGAEDCLALSEATPTNLELRILMAIERHKRMADLERANRALQNYARVVAHEVRSPLTTIATSIQCLLRNPNERFRPAAQEMIELCQTATRELTELVSGFLEFFDSGVQADVDPVDCNALIKDVVKKLAARYPEIIHKVTWGPLPVVVANERALAFAFKNLLAAALGFRADPDSGVHISWEAAKDGWVFRLGHSDTATTPSGVDAPPRPHEPIAPNGNSAGFTLGKDVIGRMGGRVWLDAPAGHTAVKLFLPRITS